MLIYLDNLVQYCADYEDFIFWGETDPPVGEPKLLEELAALRRIVELEQLGEGWHVAAPIHLMRELHCNRHLTSDQRRVYAVLSEAWQDAGLEEANDIDEKEIGSIERQLQVLSLGNADTRHLAEAIALGAIWFLTNDTRLINRTRLQGSPSAISKVKGVWVARPSECISEISRGRFLRTDQSD